jgi:mRNA interferase MazF
MVKIYTPNRGDIVWLQFDPQMGKEIQKTRPALVISPYQYNMKAGLALFMPITSQIKGYPFEELVEIDGVKGAVLCDQIRSLDWKARKAKFKAQISPLIIENVLAKIKVLL